MLVFFLAVLLAILVALTSGQHRLPSKTECRRLAAADPSNCLSSEMQSYCEDACNRQHRLSLLEKFGYSRVKSFYDLKAQDLQGRQLDFYRFRGKVVLITNVASYCGHTKQHYEQLNDLYAKFATNGDFEILAFPSNQFGGQEPGSESEIGAFCEKKGVQFRIMGKVNVNGHSTHSVYKFLKHHAGPPRISWNFATYYLVNRQGKIKSYNDVSPADLAMDIAKAIVSSEESES